MRLRKGIIFLIRFEMMVLVPIRIGSRDADQCGSRQGNDVTRKSTRILRIEESLLDSSLLRSLLIDLLRDTEKGNEEAVSFAKIRITGRIYTESAWNAPV